MAKVVRFHELGGPEVLRLEDLDSGHPGPGEAKVRIRSIGLNRSEALFRSGKYGPPPSLPARIGYEGSGDITALGDDVSSFAVGDFVSILPSFQQGRYGVYAEEAIVPVSSLLKVPDGLDPVEAAAIWMPYLTAMGLIEIGKMSAGDFVLIPAASSSVGLAAIQLANLVGAIPIAATRHDTKAAALREQGAAHVVVTEETDLVAEIDRITSGKGARLVFDPVGGPYVETLACATAEEGIIFIYGGLSGQPTPYPHWTAAVKGLSLRGWFAPAIWDKPERFARAQRLIVQGLASRMLKPVIARVFPLDQIVAAHRYLESNQQLGKIVVTP